MIADPLGVYAFQRRDRRTMKIHMAGSTSPGLCGGRAFSIAYDAERVTCRRCLTILRLYIPLEKLREHQTYMQRIRSPEHAKRIADWIANPLRRVS